MGELDDLPSWAGRRTEEVQLPGGPPETPATDDAAPESPAPPEEPEPEPTADGEPAIAAATAAAQAPETPPAAPETAPAATSAAATSVAAATPSALAGTAAPATAPVVQEPMPARRSRLRLLLFGLLGLAILAGAAAIGYVLASNDSDATEASGAGTEDAEDSADPEAGTDDQSAAGEDSTDDGDGTGDGAAAGSDGDTSTDTAGDDASDTDDGTETVTVEVDDADADTGTDADSGTDGDAALNDGGRQAVFRGGKVYLTGAVPSEEVAQTIVAKAEAVVGPGNVINEYEIDPSATIQPGDSAPLYVEDVVLFEFNSVEIAPPFLPILDLGTLLLSQNPQASVTVVTRTDAVGSEEVNLEVARRRAQAVIDYWVSQGVDPDQIIADPRGEEGTSEDDDAETAARQRRAEFVITGLLD